MIRYLLASLGGLQVGYHLAIIAGTILFLSIDFSLTPKEQGIISGAFLIGALLGSIGAGAGCNYFGRKKMHQLTALLFFIGSLLLFIAPSIPFLVIGRIIQGMGGGAATVVGPLYLAEISPPAKRGAYVSFQQLALALGILVAYGVAFIFSFNGSWRGMFGIGMIFALVHLVTFYFLPDSIPAIREKAPHPFWKELKDRRFRSSFFIVLLLNVFQQITGINAIVSFTPTILQNYGFNNPRITLFFTFLLGVFFFLVTAKSLTLLDKKGRRPLLLQGIAGMITSLIVLILCSAIFQMKWIVLGTLFIYVASFAFGFGLIPQLVGTELFSRRLRSQALGIVTSVNWFFNFFIVFTFIDFSFYYSYVTTFSLYTIFAIAAFYLTWKYLPETAGKALD